VNVAKDEKRVLTKKTHPQLFCGSTWHTTMLSESGLYKLITRSDKADAKPFQEWVTRDVLTSIRKTGKAGLFRQTQRLLQGLRGHHQLGPFAPVSRVSLAPKGVPKEEVLNQFGHVCCHQPFLHFVAQ